MTAKKKRTIKFQTENQRNPLVHARLTAADFANGVRVQIVLDGKPMTLSLKVSQMYFVEGFSGPHRRMDAKGLSSMPFKPDTFVNYDHFLARLQKVRKQPGLYFKEWRTDEGDPVTEHHERLMELLAYGCLPTWAKDEKAFVERWGPQDRWHDFHAGTAWDIVENDSVRRAA